MKNGISTPKSSGAWSRHHVRMTMHGKEVVNLPIELVADRRRPSARRSPPSDMQQRWFVDRNRMLVASLAIQV